MTQELRNLEAAERKAWNKKMRGSEADACTLYGQEGKERAGLAGGGRCLLQLPGIPRVAGEMTLHEKECAFAALALLLERAKRQGRKDEARDIRKHIREIELTPLSE